LIELRIQVSPVISFFWVNRLRVQRLLSRDLWDQYGGDAVRGDCHHSRVSPQETTGKSRCSLASDWPIC